MIKSKNRYQLSAIKQFAIDQGLSGIEITNEDYYTFVDEQWLDRHGYGSRTTRWRHRLRGEFPEPANASA